MFTAIFRKLVSRSTPRRRSARRRYCRLGFEALEPRQVLSASVIVSPLKINTSEDGGFGIVNVRLSQAPTADVTIGISSDNTNEGVPSVSQLVFNALNWNKNQAFRVTGVADGVKDGNKTFSVIIAPAVSADPNFNGVADGPDVVVTNRDSTKLLAGVTVKPTSGLKTTEEGGTASFTVKLNYQPSADVTISIAGDNLQEGTVSVGSLVFTPQNWNVLQTVTVTGRPDGIKNGSKVYHVITGDAVSGDAKYNGMAVADVMLVNIDSSKLVAGIKVSPTAGLTTTENGGTTSFNIVLTYKPSADVTIPISSSNPSVGVTNVSSVTFTPDNWNVSQAVIVTGRDDGLFNSDVRYTIITGAAGSADPLYVGMNPSDVSVTNRARTDVGRFNGLYTGTYTGTATFMGFKTPTNGSVECRVQDGVITVTVPGAGSGTLNATGAAGFGMTSGAVNGATFVGSFSTVNNTGIVTAKGTWKYSSGGVTASGFWNIVLVSKI